MINEHLNIDSSTNEDIKNIKSHCANREFEN